MTLAETQALFHAAVTGGPVAPGALEACFAGTSALPAAERVAIYAGMYLARLEEALAATFPQLRALLGAERFGTLAAGYLRAHPSEHHDIARVGRRLAAFLRAHPPSEQAERPDLADLAELEWLRQESFFAAPSPVATPAAFERLAPAAFAEARLALAPSLRIAWLALDATPLWRALEAGQVVPPAPVAAAATGPTAVAVWRAGEAVVHARLDADEAVALARAAVGDDLGRVCQAFDGRDDPAAAAHAALSSWLHEGWIAAVELARRGAAVAGGRGRRARSASARPDRR